MPLNAFSSTRLRAAGLGLGRFFRWWRSELEGAWMDWSARKGGRGQIICSAEELVLLRQQPTSPLVLARAPRPAPTSALAKAIQTLIGTQGPTLRHLQIILPPDATLRRRVPMPAAVERRLQQAVGYQLDRLMPLKSDRVYFGCTVASRNEARRRLLIDIVEVRRALADELMNSALAAGVRQVTLVCAGNTPETRAITLANRSGARAEPTLPKMERSLRWSAAALAIAIITLAFGRYHAGNTGLAESVAALKVQAAAADALRDTLQQRVNRIQFLAGRVTGADAAAVLAELTRLLPADAWVFQLQGEGDQLHIAGFTKDASALSARLSKSPIFASVSLRSAVKAPGVDDERFDIAIHLKAGARP